MLEMLNDEEILKEYTLDKMNRYNHRHRIHNESVASHSFFVSLFCLKIFSKINLPKVMERTILIKAILHDVPEVYTSDIPHDVKKSFPAIKQELEKIENIYYESNWNNYMEEIQDNHKLIFYIIKLADCYSVQQYCLNEIRLGNNSKDIQSIHEDSIQRSKNYIYLINTYYSLFVR